MAFSSIISLICLLLSTFQVHAQLSSTFYDSSCPNLISIVREQVRQAVDNENRMAASLVRLHFHDCFVNGCDASILLDGSDGEREALPNKDSVRGYNVIDAVKSAVESSCPGIVSCADIVALSARESVTALGGPSWTVDFGRRDSTTSSQSTANSVLPSPRATASELVSLFKNQGLSTTDLVALSGAHTIGQSQCRLFRSRLYNTSSSTEDPNLDASYRTELQGNCPSSGGDSNLSPLDFQTSVQFDNFYFKNLQEKKGLLFSDQELVSGGDSSLADTVSSYASNQQTFFDDFASAMVKMGRINPLTGTDGQIRTKCSSTN